MNMFVNLGTEEEFKTMIEYIAEKESGYKGQIISAMEFCGFGGNFKEEYSFMDIESVIHVERDEDGYEIEADDVCDVFKWKEFSEKSKEYFLGNYWINFSKDFDRCGETETRVFMKMETPKFTATEAINRITELQEERLPIAKGIDKLSQMAREQGGYDFDRTGLDVDFDRYREIETELSETFGI